MQNLSTKQKELIRQFCDSVTQRVPGARIKYATLSIAMNRTSIALILEKLKNRSEHEDRLFEACGNALDLSFQNDVLLTAAQEEDDDLLPSESQIIDLGFLPSHYYVGKAQKRENTNNHQVLQNVLLCIILAILLVGGFLIVHGFEKQEEKFEKLNKRIEGSSRQLESFINDYNERRKKANAPPPMLIEKSVVSHMEIGESPAQREYIARLNKVRADLSQGTKFSSAVTELDAAIIELSVYMFSEAKHQKGVRVASALRDALVIVYNKSTGKKFILPADNDLQSLSSKIDRIKLRRKIDSHVRLIIVQLDVPGWSRNMNISPDVGSSLGGELRELNDLFSESL